MDYAGQFDRLANLSDQLLSLMMSAPDERIRAATVGLIDALTPQDEGSPTGSHAVCLLFEHFAVGLKELIDVPGKIIDAVVGDEIGGSQILASAAKVMLRRAMAAAGPMAPLVPLRLKACALAIAFCPDTNKHRSLDATCAAPLFTASLDDTQP